MQQISEWKARSIPPEDSSLGALNQEMPFGLLCSSGSKNDDSSNWQARVELLDNSLIDLDLTKDTTGSGCLEIIGEKLGLSEVSLI